VEWSQGDTIEEMFFKAQNEFAKPFFLLKWLFLPAGTFGSKEIVIFLITSDLLLGPRRHSLFMKPFCMCIESRISTLILSNNGLTLCCNLYYLLFVNIPLCTVKKF
jgi:hypothetical protein